MFLGIIWCLRYEVANVLIVTYKSFIQKFELLIIYDNMNNIISSVLDNMKFYSFETLKDIILRMDLKENNQVEFLLN